MNYQYGSKSLIRYKFCGMNLWMHIKAFLETVEDHELAKVRNAYEQLCGEWSDFERDVKNEIRYLEQTVFSACEIQRQALRQIF